MVHRLSPGATRWILGRAAGAVVGGGVDGGAVPAGVGR
jgi:hypothetical protein